MKRLWIAVFGVAVLMTGAGMALAQDRTPPKTSVRAYEPPIDYRHKQFRRHRHRPPVAYVR